jgi:D-glycero-alpha-D-manno-heptose-7-phosphate kinase
VLNAAITRYVRGSISRPDASGWLNARIPLLRALEGRNGLSYSLDVPTGAGLGASAAQTVLWATLVKTSIANVTDRRRIAEIACDIAEAMGLPGGKQDEYASALGGIHLFTFGEGVSAERLELSVAATSELTARLVLVYSGQSRVSGAIHEHVWTRYRGGDRTVVAALAALKRLATDMKGALLAQDFANFGDLLNENWVRQKELHSSVTNPNLDDLMAYARRHGADGGKACGAGGGGCLILLAGQGQAGRLREALRRRRMDAIEFEFDSYGVHLSSGKAHLPVWRGTP